MAKQIDKKKAFLGIFIAAIMVLSVFGFVLSYSAGSSINYNKHKFTIIDNQYTTKIDGQEYRFNYHPLDLESLQVNQEFLGHPTYTITFDPNTTEPEYVELARYNLAEMLTKKGIAAQQGTTKKADGYTLPIITCEQDKGPTIIFENGNTTGFEQEGSCLYAKAETNTDFIRLSERIQYGILGVING